MNFLFGLILLAIGGAVTVKSEAMLNAFGRMAFFEKYLGSDGGSRLGYKLIGLLIAFIGILMATNLIGGFMGWLLSPLTKYNQPPQ